MLNMLARAKAARERGCGPADIERLEEERDALINGPLDEVLSAIYDRPIDSFEGIATLLDIAMENGDIDVPFLDHLPDHWTTMLKILKALRQQAPAIDFGAIRRVYRADVDVEAIIANA
jgi:hypothetical protein